MAKKNTIKNVLPVLESDVVAERIDDTYETKLRSTTTFNRHAIVETEVTMKKPDDLAANYIADEAVVKVNGVEVGGGGYPEPTGTIEITENGTVNVKDYAEANVNVDIPEPPTGTLDITENGTFDVTDYASANVNVQGGSSYSETLLWENPNPTVAFDSQNISEITKAIYESYDALKFVLTDLTETTPDNLNYLMLKNDTATPYDECIIYPKTFISQGVTTYYGRQLLQSSRLHIYDTNNSANYNSRCVPIAIYGVKF